MTDSLCFSTVGVSPTVWAGLALLSPAGGAPTCPTWAVSPASVAAASQGKAAAPGPRLARDPNLPLQHVWGGSEGGGRDPTLHPVISAAANLQQRGERRHQLQLQLHLQESGPAPGLGPVSSQSLNH